MRESFEISSESGTYSVLISPDVSYDQLISDKKNIILADERITQKIFDSESSQAMVIAAEESNKSLENISPLIIRMKEMGANRETMLLAIGGGIIQDIATFMASVFMRGIAWQYYPTTLLGMVDSCIGGKSSINVGPYKNLVGNFYPPLSIIIDISFLATLNQEQIVGGLCEAAKICFARNDQSFLKYLSLVSSVPLSADVGHDIVVLSLRAKKWFIEIDEFDRKERLLLNFGHTFGHALESASKFAVPHGIAVGIGMVVAEKFSQNQNLLNTDGGESVAKLTEHIRWLLKMVPESLASLKKIDVAHLMSYFDSDKKHSYKEYRVIVPVESGALIRFSVPRDTPGRLSLSKAFGSALESLL